MKAAIGFFCALCCATSLGAAPRPRHNLKAKQASAADHLGSVNFATSCSPDAQKTFNTALAMLHDFQYQQAEQTFTQITQQDPTCAMAYWGKAMSLYHQLWDWPTADTLKEGHDDTMQAQKLRAPTERERMYIVAAGVFFQNNPNLSKASRIKAYSDWMNRIFTKNPDDVNAGAFYALSLITLPGDKSDEDANRKQAIDILNKLMAVAPNNPGVLHYLIHASDTPDLASQGLVAARRYGAIAPDSSHALHMPSHIFVRLGMWDDSINANLAAEAAAVHAAQLGGSQAMDYQIHAMDFLDYSYLQSGQAAKARALIAALATVPGASAADVSNMQAVFGARNAMELHQWNDAAALPIPPSGGPVAMTYLVKTIGAARSGDASGAQQYLAKYQEAVNAAGADAEYSVASSASVGQKEAQAWVAFAGGKTNDALTLMRAAVLDEQKQVGDSDSLSTPAREMLGDLLLAMKKPSEALTEYKRSLQDSPNRFNSLYGAAQAAQLAGRATEAREFLARLVKTCAPDADRPELQQARVELAKK